ncbi:MAG: glycerophosphodiester phosphodiesterase [Polyangiaceae bacterium]|nr:glycerophosphodiester phosphodiesterase [Polyangiaceae bacterium]
MKRHPYFAGVEPHAFAHRGGARRFPENTAFAFREALALGCTHIETDLRRTRDGVIVCFHDERVERTTNGTGRVRDMTLAELKSLDAAYRFSPDGGRSFPLRGRGITVPTLEEALAVRSDARLNLEIKSGEEAIIPQLIELIEREKLHGRVLVASAQDRIIQAFRRASRHTVATSSGQWEIFDFWATTRTGLHRFRSYPFQALQVPATFHGLVIVDERFVRAAHAHGIEVHVWTVDDPIEMKRLLALGVDALMTDLPSTLLEVLGRKR